MRTLVCFLSLAALAWAGDWQKVKELKTGSDLRIYKKGAAKPIEAKSADVTEENVVVAVKNEQVAIKKADIDHIDYRPPAGKPVKHETQTVTTDGYGINRSSSSGASWSREGWQTVYRK